MCMETREGEPATNGENIAAPSPGTPLGAQLRMVAPVTLHLLSAAQNVSSCQIPCMPDESLPGALVTCMLSLSTAY